MPRKWTAPRIDVLLRGWLARLPHPLTAADRAPHIRYEVSIPQPELALTQVFDRPVQGRVWFEVVVRENLDLGRSDQVQLIFNRRVTRRTRPRHRSRVITMLRSRAGRQPDARPKQKVE